MLTHTLIYYKNHVNTWHCLHQPAIFGGFFWGYLRTWWQQHQSPELSPGKCECCRTRAKMFSWTRQSWWLGMAAGIWGGEARKGPRAALGWGWARCSPCSSVVGHTQPTEVCREMLGKCMGNGKMHGKFCSVQQYMYIWNKYVSDNKSIVFMHAKTGCLHDSTCDSSYRNKNCNSSNAKMKSHTHKDRRMDKQFHCYWCHNAE